MNSLIFTRAVRFTKFLILGGMFFLAGPVDAGWSVDFSRRQDQMAPPMSQDGAPQAEKKAEEAGIFDRVFNTIVPTQEIVIVNTEQGFIPSTVRVKEGAQYKIVVVNVNEKVKNLSFVMDSFSEHHATFFGKIKSFYISPKKEGIYTFISPETSAQGRLIVHPSAASQESLEMRLPASE